MRILAMCLLGEFDEDYRYAEDTSPVVCPGSEFIGPVASPRQLDRMREERELERQLDEWLDELLSADPSHETLRGAVCRGEIFGPLEWIGCYFTGLPLPEMTECEGHWGIVLLNRPGRPAAHPLWVKAERQRFQAELQQQASRMSDAFKVLADHARKTADQLAAAFAAAVRGAGQAQTPIHEPPESPQQRALPRPSTTPPMWVRDPTRSRRRR